ncbi:hypothetical protein ACFEMC_13110 [Kineococcus sp. DHX-1]|uniref:hypothetical protein n=1 Tax=Kineococcus sp. DHX-1 TaxID=3349638 RepID=UPI0036D366D1
MVTLGAGGTRWGLLSAAVSAAVAGFIAWRGWAPLAYVAGCAGFTAVSLVWTLLRHRGDTVTLTESSIVVRSRGGETSWAWGDVLEVSWSTGTWPSPATGPVLRVKGGAYDDPGPNVPAQVASLALFGRAQRDAAAALRTVAEQRGVPFTPGLVELVNSGKRSPRLPGERRDARGRSL